MNDSGERFFRADKGNRNAAFSFRNQDQATLAAEVAGDQSARLHPAPANLGTAQKVGDPLMEPAPASAASRASGRY